MAKTDSTCSVDGCESPQKGRGYCNKHLIRVRKHGTTDMCWPIPPAKRFWSKVQKTGGCWNWTGTRNSRGYGCFSVDYKSTLAHRWSYEHVHGPIPGDMFVDHICHNRACVNPKHLRLATNKQNVEYRSGPPANNTSGYRGVSQEKRSGRWVAYVVHHGKNHSLGSYATAEEADAAARAKRAELFTFPEVA